MIVLTLAGPVASAAERTADEDTQADLLMQPWSNRETKAPVDFGPGRGRPRPRAHRALVTGAASTAAATVIPVGGSDAGYNGYYAPAAPWPIVPIHLALLPDGRVMSYGSDENGVQGAELYYDIWDPSLGTDSVSHTVLPNTTGTDIFCSGLALMWTTGDLLMVGGDQRPKRPYVVSVAATTLFSPPSNTIATVAQMAYPRWYGTLVALPSGDLVAIGGRQGSSIAAGDIPASTPEVFDQVTGWHSLTAATSDAAFYNGVNWFYPRAYVAPNGLIFVLTHSGGMYWLDPTGAGTLTPAGTIEATKQAASSVMFAPGKILALRGNNKSNTAYVIDINGATPTVTPTTHTAQKRWWANATVMPDGQVLINGGSSVGNVLSGLQYQNEIWNPTTGTMTLGAIASKPRLYHSNALLLPDGSVLTGGGGAPGPVANLNVELFYPPYLYLNDGSGQPAPRPALQAASAIVQVGAATTAQVGDADAINRLTLVKFGASTHSMDIDQRFIELSFVQTGSTLAFTLPSNPNLLMPGYYMLFAFNTAGTPSVASVVQVTP